MVRRTDCLVTATVMAVWCGVCVPPSMHNGVFNGDLQEVLKERDGKGREAERGGKRIREEE